MLTADIATTSPYSTQSLSIHKFVPQNGKAYIYSVLLCTYFRLVHESQLHKPTSDQTVLDINSIAISTNGIYTYTKEDTTKGPVGK